MPLAESGMRHRPLTPMTDPNLVRVLQRQTPRKVGLRAHDRVRRGTAAIREHMEALQAAGIAIVSRRRTDASVRHGSESPAAAIAARVCGVSRLMRPSAPLR